MCYWGASLKHRLHASGSTQVGHSLPTMLYQNSVCGRPRLLLCQTSDCRGSSSAGARDPCCRRTHLHRRPPGTKLYRGEQHLYRILHPAPRSVFSAIETSPTDWPGFFSRTAGLESYRKQDGTLPLGHARDGLAAPRPPPCSGIITNSHSRHRFLCRSTTPRKTKDPPHVEFLTLGGSACPLASWC